MGTISANKLGGLALMIAPVVTLILYFLQPGGAFVDAADPADGTATIAAMLANAGLGKVVSVLIPLGLIVFLYGVFVLQENIRSNGNGDALSRLGVLMILIGVVGWTIGSGVSLAITGSDLPLAQAVPVYGSLYSASVGIGTIAGIIWATGTLLVALAVSTRDDANKIFALIAAVAGAVAVALTIIGAVDSAQMELMGQITGIVYLVHMAWFFVLGLNMVKE